MLVPKFREFITEQDLDRKAKPITIAMVTVADSKDPKENTTADLVQKACKKKGIKCVIVNTKTTIITSKDEDKGTLEQEGRGETELKKKCQYVII